MNDNLPSDDLVNVLQKIADMAKADGKITLEEYELLRGLSYDTAEYMMALEESKGEIGDEERKQLLKLKRKIIENAKRVAGKNGVVTDDEAQMIDKLIELLNKES